MIVIDTSALVALRLQEPESVKLSDRIAKEQRRLVPATSVVEFALLRRLGASRRGWLQGFLAEVGADISPIDADVAAMAADAAERYGKGSGNPARLNFGDCLSYAVAKCLGAPLLYKGNDFDHTDIESALPK